MKGLRLALGFLTTLPVRPPKKMAAGDLGMAAGWYPLIGLAMGALLWGLHTLFSSLFPELLAGALLLATWVIMSGGLHLDGWADCCDGLFVSAPREQRLSILRDTQLGAFAAVGLITLLLVKLTALAALVDPRGLLLAPALGRGLLVPMARMKPARSEGLGATLHQEISWPSLLPLLLVLPVIYWLGSRGFLALLFAALVALAWSWLAQRRLGGHTGDVLGAACELMELAVLLAFSWSL